MVQDTDGHVVTCYVDPLAAWGWRIRGREVESCHLCTDDPTAADLHALARSIGLKPSWFQSDAHGRWWRSHYDLTPSRRTAAVRLGAVELTNREAVALRRFLAQS